MRAGPGVGVERYRSAFSPGWWSVNSRLTRLHVLAEDILTPMSRRPHAPVKSTPHHGHATPARHRWATREGPPRREGVSSYAPSARKPPTPIPEQQDPPRPLVGVSRPHGTSQECTATVGGPALFALAFGLWGRPAGTGYRRSQRSKAWTYELSLSLTRAVKAEAQNEGHIRHLRIDTGPTAIDRWSAHRVHGNFRGMAQGEAETPPQTDEGMQR